MGFVQLFRWLAGCTLLWAVTATPAATQVRDSTPDPSHQRVADFVSHTGDREWHGRVDRSRIGAAESGLTLKDDLPHRHGWMAPDVPLAWDAGYNGQDATITLVDDFTGGHGLIGDFGSGWYSRSHGGWTSAQAGMIAPAAEIRGHALQSDRAVGLVRGFNVVNLSYSLMAAHGYDADSLNWAPREMSIISYARAGSALVSKAAGNDGVALGAPNSAGRTDYLATALIGSRSVVFVGALSANGTVDRPASLAWYSNTPGTNRVAQQQFLVIGVEGAETGLVGTSFAAPIVAGYGAILSSKFTSASPRAIAGRLLDTARSNTIRNYNVELHGRGEACLSCALAPTNVN